MTPVDSLQEAALDLSWSLWGELGVSTWARGHEEWAVEVEPLMVLTAITAPRDPRLLRESIDWCARFSEFVSVNQFRHVVTESRLPFVGDVDRYSATLSAHTPRKWSATSRAQPYMLERGGASRAPDFAAPAVIQLRIRALLGVSARAEVLRVLVTHSPRTWTIAEISEHVAYTRRQVALALHSLAVAQVVHAVGSEGRNAYVVPMHETLAEIVGEIPRVVPRWGPLVGVLATVIQVVSSIVSNDLAMPETELSRQLRRLRPRFKKANVYFPELDRANQVDEFVDWSQSLFVSLASGNPLYLLPLARSQEVNG